MGRAYQQNCRDDNEQEIIDALHSEGAQTFQIENWSDLLVLYRGRWIVIEVKDGSKPPSRRKLTNVQQAFFISTRGAPRYLVKDVAGAMFALADGIKDTHMETWNG